MDTISQPLSLSELARDAARKYNAEVAEAIAERDREYRTRRAVILIRMLRRALGDDITADATTNGDVDTLTATIDGLTFALYEDELRLLIECPRCHKPAYHRHHISNLASLGNALLDPDPTHPWGCAEPEPADDADPQPTELPMIGLSLAERLEELLVELIRREC